MLVYVANHFGRQTTSLQSNHDYLRTVALDIHDSFHVKAVLTTAGNFEFVFSHEAFIFYLTSGYIVRLMVRVTHV